MAIPNMTLKAERGQPVATPVSLEGDLILYQPAETSIRVWHQVSHRPSARNARASIVEDSSERRAFHAGGLRGGRSRALRRADRRSAMLQLVAHNRSDLGAQDLYRVQHFLVR
jgi:hypothetical protein